jgi:hypothetical protein
MNHQIQKLGKLQQKILQHIIECERPWQLETANHIARALHRSQPTIFKSVRNLIRNRYLDDVKYGNDFGNDLIVTSKGAAAAIISGVILDRIEKYISNLKTSNYKLGKYINYVQENADDYKEKYARGIHYHFYTNSIDYDDVEAKIANPCETIAIILKHLKRIAEPHNKLDHVIKKAMIYALENDYFENGDVTKRLTTEQIGKIQLFIALQHIQALGDIPTLKQFVSKYEINKGFLKKQLRRQREYINLAIKELG